MLDGGRMRARSPIRRAPCSASGSPAGTAAPQLVNEPGRVGDEPAQHAPIPSARRAFYGAVFGWQAERSAR